MKSPSWGTSTAKNNFIYQTYLASDVAGMKAGVQKSGFINGVNYLMNSIKNGVPVMFGVDDNKGSSNTDQTTDHYVIITGMGHDSKGNYFSFFDNATGNNANGTSSNNKLYVNENTMTISGTAVNNGYIEETDYKSYTVTQIRETRL